MRSSKMMNKESESPAQKDKGGAPEKRTRCAGCRFEPQVTMLGAEVPQTGLMNEATRTAGGARILGPNLAPMYVFTIYIHPRTDQVTRAIMLDAQATCMGLFPMYCQARQDKKKQGVGPTNS